MDCLLNQKIGNLFTHWLRGQPFTLFGFNMMSYLIFLLLHRRSSYRVQIARNKPNTLVATRNNTKLTKRRRGLFKKAKSSPQKLQSSLPLWPATSMPLVIPLLTLSWRVTKPTTAKPTPKSSLQRKPRWWSEKPNLKWPWCEKSWEGQILVESSQEGDKKPEGFAITNMPLRDFPDVDGMQNIHELEQFLMQINSTKKKGLG